MADNSSKSFIERLIATHGPQERAHIEPVSVEVRTGERFILTDPLRSFRPPPQQYTIQQRLLRRGSEMYIGGIVVTWGFDLKKGKDSAFQRWLFDNEQDLYDTRPDIGVRYAGTYAVYAASEPHAGSYRTIWAFDSFKNFDDFGMAMAEQYPTQGPRTAFGELVREYFSFWDDDPKGDRSQQTLVLAVSSHSTRPFAT